MAMPTRWNPIRQGTRFDPFNEMEGLFRGLGLQPLREQSEMMELRADVTEDENAYRIEIDIPGVKKEDIEVSVEGSDVMIRAETRGQSEGGSGRKVHVERYTGQLFRSFSLPHEFDSDRCEAHYQDGVLSLTLPKRTGGESKRLPIH